MGRRGDRVPLRRMLVLVAGLYVIEGFPMGVFRVILPAWWVESGVSTAQIGFASGLSVAWSLKVFWSPLVQWRGDDRAWISASLLVMSGALFALSGLDPGQGSWVWWLVGGFCLASATQDIAIDATTIGFVPRGDEGPANAMRVAAYRLSFAVFGTAALFLPGVIGWSGTLSALAVVPLAMAGAVWLSPARPRADTHDAPLWHAFHHWTKRRELWAVAAFVVLFRLSDFGLGPMLIPFQLDRGLSRETVGVLSGVVGGIGLVAGATLGGTLVHRLGIPRALAWTGILAVASNALYAVAALDGMTIEVLYAASVGESLTGGMVTAAFMSFLMRICQREWAAVQYATLTALYPFVGHLFGTLSGVLTEAVGFAGYFALTTLFTLPAFAFLPAVGRWVADSIDDDLEPGPGA